MDVELRSIEISPIAVSQATGLTQQFLATATLNDNSKQDITADSFWEISDSSILAISNGSENKGLMTALSPGEASVFATYDNIESSHASVLVVDANLTGITLKLVDGSEPTNLSIALGSGLNIVAEGVFSDGSRSDITNLVTWQSSVNNIASISNDASSKGLINSLDIGTTTISVNFNGFSSATVILDVMPAVLEKVSLTPEDINLNQGQSKLFSLMGIYSNGPSMVNLPVIWNSDNVDIATVIDGTATAVSTGVVTISASVENAAGKILVATATLKVDIAPTIILSPADGSFIKVDDLLPMVASGGTEPYFWVVSDTNLATIDEFSGQLTALMSGTIKVTATDANQYFGTVSLSIEPSIRSISISSDASNNTLLSGDSVTFHALATYSDGSSENISNSASWSLSTSVNMLADISPGFSNVVNTTAGLIGSMAMTATLGGKSTVASISIIAPTIKVSYDNAVTSISVGDTLQLSATGGTGSYTWKGSNSNASIDSVGILSANAAGSIDVIATDSNGFTGSLTIVITAPTNSPPTASAGVNQAVTSGETVMLTGQGSDSDGTIVEYLWTIISAPTVTLSSATTATTSFIAPTVTVTTIINLQLTVTDNSGASANSSVAVTVTPTPVTLVSIQVTSDANATQTDSVISGSLITFKAQASYSDGSTAVISLDGSTLWSMQVTPTTLATANANLVQTHPLGAATGSLTMTASKGLISGSLTISVVAPKIDISTTDPGPVAGGSAVSYSATGGTAPYVWELINTSLATMDPGTGSLLPLLPGDTQIIVTDANGFTGSMNLTIATAANSLPLVNAGVDQIVVSGVMVYLNATATDSDGNIGSYRWQQDSGPAVTLLTPTAASTSFVAPNTSTSAIVGLRLTVTDNSGATATASLSVTSKPVATLTIADIVPSIVDPGLQRCITDEAATYYSGGVTAVLDFDQIISFCEGSFTPNPITKLFGIENLQGLVYFSAQSSNITDLTPLTRLPILTTIDVSYNVDTLGNPTIATYAPLTTMTTLESLYVLGNNLTATDMAQITTNTQLLELGLSLNPLTDVDIVGLGSLINLQTLELSEVPVTSIALLAPLSKLEQLILTRMPLGTAGPSGIDVIRFTTTPVRFPSTKLYLTETVNIPCVELDAFIANNPTVSIISGTGPICI